MNSSANPKLRAWENPPLNRLGQLDAQLAGQKLKRYKPQMVYSSDLARDSETAFILADVLGNLPVDIDYALRTADMGDWSGMPEEAVREKVEEWYDNPWKEAPGGESNNQFLRRFYPAFDTKYELAQKVPSFRPSVIVTHGRNIAAVHARANSIPQKEALMPCAGGIMLVYGDEVDRPMVEFVTEVEPVHTDV